MFTETVCDMTNADLRRNIRFPEHPLEKQAGVKDFCDNKDSGPDTTEAQRPITWSHKDKIQKRAVAYMDIFVDAFCGVGQDSNMNPLANQRRTLMHNIDKVFRPNDDEDHQYRKEPISISKLAKGDASFQDKKKCLGWDFGGRSKTLFVAAHRRDKAITNLSATLQKPWATLNE
jgi:hypothetical protein